MEFFTPDTVADCVGQTVHSRWLTITQAMISGFGEVTLDPDPLHTDEEYCRQHSPFGRPIAHGFLTISLLSSLIYDVYKYPMDASRSEGFPLNYGFQRLRLVSAVPVDARIRAAFTVDHVTERKPGQQLTLFDVVLEREGTDIPVLTAGWETLWVRPA